MLFFVNTTVTSSDTKPHWFWAYFCTPNPALIWKRSHPTNVRPHNTPGHATRPLLALRPARAGAGRGPPKLRRRSAPGAGCATGSLTSKQFATAAVVAAERLPVSRRSRCPAQPGPTGGESPAAGPPLSRGAPGARPGPRPHMARDCSAAPARPCPRGLSGRCGVGWRAREGRRDEFTDGRRERDVSGYPGAWVLYFVIPVPLYSADVTRNLKALLGSACGRNQFKFGAGGSTEQLPLLSSNCALVTISNKVMQYHLIRMGFISACWPIFLLLSKIFLYIDQNSLSESWRENRLWRGSHRYYKKCFMCVMVYA